MFKPDIIETYFTKNFKDDYIKYILNISPKDQLENIINLIEKDIKDADNKTNIKNSNFNIPIDIKTYKEILNNTTALIPLALDEIETIENINQLNKGNINNEGINIHFDLSKIFSQYYDINFTIGEVADEIYTNSLDILKNYENINLDIIQKLFPFCFWYLEFNTHIYQPIKKLKNNFLYDINALLDIYFNLEDNYTQYDFCGPAPIEYFDTARDKINYIIKNNNITIGSKAYSQHELTELEKCKEDYKYYIWSYTKINFLLKYIGSKTFCRYALLKDKESLSLGNYEYTDLTNSIIDLYPCKAEHNNSQCSFRDKKLCSFKEENSNNTKINRTKIINFIKNKKEGIYIHKYLTKFLNIKNDSSLKKYINIESKKTFALKLIKFKYFELLKNKTDKTILNIFSQLDKLKESLEIKQNEEKEFYFNDDFDPYFVADDSIEIDINNVRELYKKYCNFLHKNTEENKQEIIDFINNLRHLKI